MHDGPPARFVQPQDLIAALLGTKLPMSEAQPWRWAVGQTLQYAGLRGASLTATDCWAWVCLSLFSVTRVTALAAI